MGGIFGAIRAHARNKMEAMNHIKDKNRGDRIDFVFDNSHLSLGVQSHSKSMDVHSYSTKKCVLALHTTDRNGYSCCKLLEKEYASQGLQGLMRVIEAEFHFDFSVALYDLNKRALILASDPMNIRKIYYSYKGSNIWYSSSLRHVISFLENEGILRFPLNEIEIDLRSLIYFLSYGIFPSTSTIFSRIAKIPPNSLLYFVDGMSQPKIIKYSSHPHTRAPQIPEDSIIEEIYDLLLNAIKMRLDPSINVVLLSGGLDSGIISSLLVKVIEPRNVIGLNISINGQYSETEKARKIADILGIKIVEERIDPSANYLYNIFTNTMTFLDEPSLRSAYLARYIAIKRGADYSNTIFFGEGGDELFLGYFLHIWAWHDKLIARLASRVPNLVRKTGIELLEVLLPILKSPSILKGKDILKDINDLLKLTLILNAINPPSLTSRYLSPLNGENYFMDPYLESICTINSRDRASITSIILLNFLIQSDITTIENICARSGLRPEFPLLDWNLAKKIASIPTYLRLKNGSTKYLMCKIAEKYNLLPEKIVHQKKRGLPKLSEQLFQDTTICNKIIRDYSLPLHSSFLKNLITNLLRSRYVRMRVAGGVLSVWLSSMNFV